VLPHRFVVDGLGILGRLHGRALRKGQQATPDPPRGGSEIRRNAAAKARSIYEFNPNQTADGPEPGPFLRR